MSFKEWYNERAEFQSKLMLMEMMCRLYESGIDSEEKFNEWWYEKGATQLIETQQQEVDQVIVEFLGNLGSKIGQFATNAVNNAGRFLVGDPKQPQATQQRTDPMIDRMNQWQKDQRDRAAHVAQGQKTQEFQKAGQPVLNAISSMRQSLIRALTDFNAFSGRVARSMGNDRDILELAGSLQTKLQKIADEEMHAYVLKVRDKMAAGYRVNPEDFKDAYKNPTGNQGVSDTDLQQSREKYGW